MNSSTRRATRPYASAIAPCALPFALAAFGALMTTAAQAQTSTGAALSTVVVTATRSPMQLSDVVADVTVITREDIARLGAGDITDLLHNSGAVEFARNGGPGTTSSLYIRGAETRHTMVLIDGVRVDDQSVGGAPWESIPLSQIERIEIVKGPASAIYGSDALGGVLQIITRKGTDASGLDVGVAGGSLGTARTDASVLGRTGMFDYAVSAATEHSNGIALVTDPTSSYYNPERAGYQKHSWSVRLGAQLDAQDRLEFVSLNSHLNAEYSGYDEPTALDHNIEDTSVDKLSWSRQWSKSLSTQLSASQSDIRDIAQDPSSPFLSETRIRSYELQGNWRVDAQQQLLFVLERREDSLINSYQSNTGSLGSGSRSDNGAALGYIWQMGPLELQAHARHDQDSEFGSANTGSLGLGYRLSDSLRLVGSVSNAFRAPTLSQNASYYGPLSLANGISLKPETSHNSELGLKYGDRTLDASITVYRNLVDNLIQFAPVSNCAYYAANPAFGSCYANVAQARLQGVSMSAGYQLADVHLSGTLDLQAPKDLSTGDLLPRRARRFGTLRAQTLLQGWTLGAGLIFSSSRQDLDYNTYPAQTVTLGGYSVLNLDAGYSLTHDLKLQLNLDNAFNRVYQTAYGYAQLPRTVMVGLRYTPAF